MAQIHLRPLHNRVSMCGASQLFCETHFHSSLDWSTMILDLHCYARITNFVVQVYMEMYDDR